MKKPGRYSEKGMVWIRCTSGEFLDPAKITAIRVTPSYSSPDEVEITAEYGGHTFLLLRAPASSLRAAGIRNSPDRFRVVMEKLLQNPGDTRVLTFERILGLMLAGDEPAGAAPPAPAAGPGEAPPEP